MCRFLCGRPPGYARQKVVNLTEEEKKEKVMNMKETKAAWKRWNKCFLFAEWLIVEHRVNLPSNIAKAIK